MRKNIENNDPNCDSGNDILQGSKTKTNNEILEVFSDSDGGVTFFNYCKNHGIERKDGKDLGYKNCMDTSIVYIDKDGKEYKLYSSGADFNEDVGAAAEYDFVEISENVEKQENLEKDEEFESLLNGKQINWMGNYRIFTSFGSVLIIIDDNDKYGVVNLKGEKIVGCEYDRIDENGIIRKGDKYGLISKTGEIIKSVRYDSVNCNGYDKTFLVEMDGKRGILDNQGSEILKCILAYDYVEGSRNGTYKVKKDGKYGIIDNKGNLIIAVQYDDVYERYDKGGYSVSLDGKKGFINDKREVIIPIKYDEILKRSKGNCYEVKLNGRRGIIDSKGGVILPIQYEEIDTISKGKYKVKLAGKWRIVNNKGETIKELQYKNSEELDRGVNRVEIEDGFENEYVGKYSKYGLIDSYGHEILPVKYSSIKKISEGIYEVWNHEFFMGVVDKNGVEIVPVIYKDLRVLKSDKNLLIVQNKSGKYGIINMENEIIIPFEFDMIREVYVKAGKFGKNEYNIYVQKEGKLGQLSL